MEDGGNAVLNEGLDRGAVKGANKISETLQNNNGVKFPGIFQLLTRAGARAGRQGGPAVEEAINTSFCPLRFLAPRKKYFWAPVKSPYEITRANLYLVYLSPPDPRCVEKLAHMDTPRAGGRPDTRRSVGDNCPILPCPGEISYRCFQGREEYF